MALTLSELREEVRAAIRRPVGGFSNDRIDRRINWAQREVAILHTFREMEKVFQRDTVDSQYRYGYPERWKEVYSIVLRREGGSRKLIYMKPRDFDEQVPKPSIYEGTPTYWVDYGTSFELYPVPNDAWRMIVRLAQYPEDFSVDGDTSTLLDKDDLLIAIATYYSLQSLAEDDLAAYWKDSVVPTVYQKALRADSNDRDWQPIAKPFTIRSSGYRDYRSPFA